MLAVPGRPFVLLLSSLLAPEPRPLTPSAFASGVRLPVLALSSLTGCHRLLKKYAHTKQRVATDAAVYTACQSTRPWLRREL
jgi:hypothetical protein